MNWIEKATVDRLKAAGMDFTPYLNPVPFIPPHQMKDYEEFLEEMEEEEEEEEDE